MRFNPVSPAGERLGPPTPDADLWRQALNRWFQAADRNHDQALDQAELLADTERVFALFDRNGDGTITSSELTAMRIESPHQIREAPADSRRARPEDATPGHAQTLPNERGRRTAVCGFLDPVMSADADADFRVTRAELQAQALNTWRSWDLNSDGTVNQTEWTTTLQADLQAVAN